MIRKLHLKNFKGFKDHTITFGEFSVVVGRNNAGKSSAIEALRIVSTIIRKFSIGKYTNRPPWLEGDGVGLLPALDDIKFKPETIFFKYDDPPAIITATFETGSQITIYFGPGGVVYSEATTARGLLVNTRQIARKCEFTPICILPQILPLEDTERVLRKAYVEKCIETHLSSRHFRNQIRYLHKHFDAFRDLFQQTWDGVRISTFDDPDANYEEELDLMLSEDGFVAEASNFGHGLQMWLQIVWFLSRTDSDSVVILDEPDVYMHMEQQSKMIDMLRGRFRQCILSTHAIKIIEGCDESEILRLHRKLPSSSQGVDQVTHDNLVDHVLVNSRRESLVDQRQDDEVTLKVVIYDESTVVIIDENGETILELGPGGDDGTSAQLTIKRQRLRIEILHSECADIYINQAALDLRAHWKSDLAKLDIDLHDAWIVSGNRNID